MRKINMGGVFGKLISVSAVIALTIGTSYASSYGIIDYGVVKIDAADIQANTEAIYQLNQTLSDPDNGLTSYYDSGHEAGYQKALDDHSDGTATPAHILDGKTAYNGGNLLVGSMPNCGALNWAPASSTTYTVPAGYYSGGTLSTANAYSSGYNNGYSAGYAARQVGTVTNIYHLHSTTTNTATTQNLALSNAQPLTSTVKGGCYTIEKYELRPLTSLGNSRRGGGDDDGWYYATAYCSECGTKWTAHLGNNNNRERALQTETHECTAHPYYELSCGRNLGEIVSFIVTY